ncbi:MAG TPA: IS30 family transposase [Ruminococcus flavefaciens]|jgi:IS30 family transposase|nr:IS30 family transposase [Ruminococcus flavefaciens]
MKPYTHFTLSERNCLQQLLSEGKSYREIAKVLDRSPSTISREVKRNFSKKKKRYNAWRATTLYIIRRRNCVRKHTIQPNTDLYEYIISCLKKYWSPEIIAYKCTEQGFSICTATIYRALKEKRLVGITPKTHLRRHGKKTTSDRKNCSTIHPVHTIHERPEIVEAKGRFGDFEGDTVYGCVGKGCAVTLVDRKSKLLIATIAANREKGTIREAFKRAFALMEHDIPIKTITLDNGSEFADFLNIEKDLQTTIYFADPHSPWQRGLNENTNDILRFFYPKGTNFLNVTEEEFQNVVHLINSRPRKCLGYLSPLEFLDKKCCT